MNHAAFNVSKIARAVALGLVPAALIVGCAGKDTLVKPEEVTSQESHLESTETTVSHTEELSTDEITVTEQEASTITAWSAIINDTNTDETVVESNMEEQDLAEVETMTELNDTMAQAIDEDGQAGTFTQPLDGDVRDSRYMEVNLIQPEADNIEAPEQFVFHFASSRFDIDQAGLDELSKHARYLRENPGMVLNINGFSDARGSESYNFKLSKKRAQVIEKALLALGVSQSQLIVNAYGESFPLNEESNYDENRRVELEYIERDASIMASK